MFKVRFDTLDGIMLLVCSCITDIVFPMLGFVMADTSIYDWRRLPIVIGCFWGYLLVRNVVSRKPEGKG